MASSGLCFGCISTFLSSSRRASDVRMSSPTSAPLARRARASRWIASTLGTGTWSFSIFERYVKSMPAASPKSRSVFSRRLRSERRYVANSLRSLATSGPTAHESHERVAPNSSVLTRLEHSPRSCTQSTTCREDARHAGSPSCLSSPRPLERPSCQWAGGHQCPARETEPFVRRCSRGGRGLQGERYAAARPQGGNGPRCFDTLAAMAIAHSWATYRWRPGFLRLHGTSSRGVLFGGNCPGRPISASINRRRRVFR